MPVTFVRPVFCRCQSVVSAHAWSDRGLGPPAAAVAVRGAPAVPAGAAPGRVARCGLRGVPRPGTPRLRPLLSVPPPRPARTRPPGRRGSPDLLRDQGHPIRRPPMALQVGASALFIAPAVRLTPAVRPGARPALDARRAPGARLGPGVGPGAAAGLPDRSRPLRVAARRHAAARPSRRGPDRRRAPGPHPLLRLVSPYLRLP